VYNVLLVTLMFLFGTSDKWEIVKKRLFLLGKCEILSADESRQSILWDG